MIFRLKRFSALIFAILALGGLAGCSTMVAVPGDAPHNAPVLAENDGTFLLNTGDTIKLVVYGEEGSLGNTEGNMTGSYPVDGAGMVTIPMIGDVQAAGHSKDELRESIVARLVDGGFLVNPLVTVDVVATRPFYIVGEVKNPGSYPWQPSIDALKAVAIAGGYTPRAAKNKILVERVVGEDKGAQKMRMNATEDTIILPGDSLIVRERIF